MNPLDSKILEQDRKYKLKCSSVYRKYAFFYLSKTKRPMNKYLNTPNSNGDNLKPSYSAYNTLQKADTGSKQEKARKTEGQPSFQASSNFIWYTFRVNPNNDMNYLQELNFIDFSRSFNPFQLCYSWYSMRI